VRERAARVAECPRCVVGGRRRPSSIAIDRAIELDRSNAIDRTRDRTRAPIEVEVDRAMTSSRDWSPLVPGRDRSMTTSRGDETRRGIFGHAARSRGEHRT
jgi:hypothetical protein